MVEIIREVNPAVDAGSYGELQRIRSAEGFGPPSNLQILDPGKWESLLSRKALTLVAVAEDGRIVGTSGAKILKDEKTANLRGLFVLPEYRNQGIGTALVKGTLDQLRTAGVATVLTEIETGNEHSMEQHRKIGFTPISEIVDQQGKTYTKLQLFLT